MANPPKAQILKMCNVAPVKSLVKFIDEGVVTFDELCRAGLSTTRQEQITNMLAAREGDAWNNILANPTVDSILSYTKTYPQGTHIYEAKEKLLDMEEDVWHDAVARGSVTDYQRYNELFPTGRHVAEAAEIVADPEWAETRRINTLAAYQAYRGKNPGKHAQAVEDAIQNLTDGEDWGTAMASNTPEAFDRYIQQHPRGAHVDEAKNFKDDYYWRNAIFSPSAESYSNYLQQMPTGRYVEEARKQLDELDWQEAMRIYTRASMDNYMINHPEGIHFDEAKQMWEDLGSREEVIEKLSMDQNAYSAEMINEFINRHIITRDEVIGFYGPERAQKIFDFYRVPIPAPVGPFLPELGKGPTEVYFWGTPASGKTCALGAVLSTAHSRYALDGQMCRGYDYMNKLSNVFSKGNGLCILPDSTANDVIADMVMQIRDRNGNKHALTLIDIAGEIFRAIYADFTNQYIDGQTKATLSQIQKYLANKNNKKIHFFVVEYGAHDKEWEQNTMSNYLQTCAAYLKNSQILKGQTVGVYIIVTKCDKIGCSPEEMPQMALQYVQQYLNAFYVNLQDACKEAGIRDFKVVSFSVGEVFAQQLCYYNDHHTDKVIDILLNKTPAIKNSFWRS